jgi:hypothetical protein
MARAVAFASHQQDQPLHVPQPQQPDAGDEGAARQGLDADRGAEGIRDVGVGRTDVVAPQFAARIALVGDARTRVLAHRAHQFDRLVVVRRQRQHLPATDDSQQTVGIHQAGRAERLPHLQRLRAPSLLLFTGDGVNPPRDVGPLFGVERRDLHGLDQQRRTATAVQQDGAARAGMQGQLLPGRLHGCLRPFQPVHQPAGGGQQGGVHAGGRGALQQRRALRQHGFDRGTRGAIMGRPQQPGARRPLAWGVIYR